MRRRVLVGLLMFALARPMPSPAQEGPMGPEPAPAPEVVEDPNSLEPIRRAQRSARLGVAMTVVVPGWGQLYADSPFWGLVAFGVQMYYLGSILLEDQRVDRARVERDRYEPGTADYEFRDGLVTEHRERRRDYVWWAAAGYFVIALDSYVSVSLADFDDPGVPVPDLDRDWDDSGPSGAGVALRVDFGF